MSLPASDVMVSVSEPYDFDTAFLLKMEHGEESPTWDFFAVKGRVLLKYGEINNRHARQVEKFCENEGIPLFYARERPYISGETGSIHNIHPPILFL